MCALKGGIIGKKTIIVCKLSEFFYFCKSNFNIKLIYNEVNQNFAMNCGKQKYTHMYHAQSLTKLLILTKILIFKNLKNNKEIYGIFQIYQC